MFISGQNALNPTYSSAEEEVNDASQVLGTLKKSDSGEYVEVCKKSDGEGITQIANNVLGEKACPQSDQRKLIEKALHDASENGMNVAKNIQSYGINKETEEGQRGLIEIAKEAARHDGKETSQNIQNFGINKETEEGQKALVEIAKIAARQNGLGISCFIHKYGINKETEEGQKALIEIAMIAAEQNGSAVSLYIENYEINGETKQGQKGLIAIAKKAALQNGPATSQYIRNYGIKGNTERGQKGLIKIAKIAALKHGAAISQFLRNYGINKETAEDQKALIEIAKLIAWQSGWTSSKYILNFGINTETEEGQKALIEIVNIAIRNDWRAFNNLIDHANTSVQELKMIYYALANVLKEGSSGVLPTLFIDHPIFNEIFGKLAQSQVSDLRNISLEQLQKFTLEMEKLFRKNWPNNKSIPLILKQIAELKKAKNSSFQEHRAIQLQQLSFVLMALVDCYDLSEKAFEELYAPIILACLNLREPKLREDIWNLLFKQNLSFSLTSKTPRHAILPSLLLHYLKIEDPEISLIIRSLKGTKNLIFKDASLNRLLLKTLLGLCEEPKLEKKELLAKALSFRTGGNEGDKDKIYQALQLVKGIVALGAGNELTKSINEPNFIEVLNQIYLEAFRQVVPIKNDIADFAEKFEAMQSSFRVPNAILTYASVLKSLPDKEKKVMFRALATCLEEVIEGNFSNNRYQSRHLESIFKGHEDLENAWKKGEKIPLISMLDKEIRNNDVIDFRKLLLSSFKEKHADKNNYPFLYKFLKTENNSILNALEEQFRLERDEDNKKILHLQIKLIELAKANGNEKELLREAIGLLPKVNEFGYALQFNADVRGFLLSLQEKEQKNDFFNWTIEDTDNFEDLFLSGTEVEGSCQNINGKASQNKCLLGYVADGKNRLLAIKDSTGKIKARAILRLLLKSNEPVLFIERVYPKVVSDKLEAALLNFALHRSRDLKLKLLSKEVHQSNSIAKEELVSLGSRAPYEYVDAQDGIHEEGKFSISQAYFLK